MELAIHPTSIAFDIDGVVADTMQIFVKLAQQRYGLIDLRKEHLYCYDLHECVPANPEVVNDLICLTLDDEHTLQVPPIPGAPEVLTELAQWGPLRFVTARLWPESIIKWLYQTLPRVPEEQIQVIATGDPASKLKILQELQVRYFVEDRLETCEILSQDGIQPLLFDQPWNRGVHSFPRIESWAQLRRCLLI
jgi:5'(3')-deoxyribonucleotidase